MTVTRPAKKLVFSVDELDAYLARRIGDLDADCFDGETVGHIGLTRHHKSLGARAALLDVRQVIQEWRNEEADDQTVARAQDSEEARWREALDES